MLPLRQLAVPTARRGNYGTAMVLLLHQQGGADSETDTDTIATAAATANVVVVAVDTRRFPVQPMRDRGHR